MGKVIVLIREGKCVILMNKEILCQGEHTCGFRIWNNLEGRGIRHTPPSPAHTSDTRAFYEFFFSFQNPCYFYVPFLWAKGRSDSVSNFIFYSCCIFFSRLVVGTVEKAMRSLYKGNEKETKRIQVFAELEEVSHDVRRQGSCLQASWLQKSKDGGSPGVSVLAWGWGIGWTREAMCSGS